MFKVFFKKFYGPKYKMFFIGLLTIFLMYCATYDTQGIMDFNTFLLSNTILTIIIAYQSITSKDNSESFKRLFTYPLNKCEFKFKYILSLLVYSFTTRNLVLYVVYTKTIIINELLIFILSFISISLLTIAAFILLNKKNKKVNLLLLIEIPFYLLCEDINIIIVSYIINIFISLVIIQKANIIDFLYIPKLNIKNFKDTYSNFFTYIKRYFLFNKSYIFSILIMFLVACLYTSINNNFSDSYVPYILVTLMYNTPLSIVISINKSLQKKIKSYPNQIKYIFTPYFFFVFLINFSVTILFLLFLKTINNPILFVAQIIFSIENALLTVFFEYKYPITKWNTETELWNNPRKYITLSILMVQAAICSYFL